mgnify:CR=1 FL=1
MTKVYVLSKLEPDDCVTENVIGVFDSYDKAEKVALSKNLVDSKDFYTFIRNKKCGFEIVEYILNDPTN